MSRYYNMKNIFTWNGEIHVFECWFIVPGPVCSILTGASKRRTWQNERSFTSNCFQCTRIHEPVFAQPGKNFFICTYSWLLLRNIRTCCVDYNEKKVRAAPMGIPYLHSACLREHLLKHPTLSNCLFDNKDLRGTNGGLSNVVLVQPCWDPSTKLDGSFIS